MMMLLFFVGIVRMKEHIHQRKQLTKIIYLQPQISPVGTNMHAIEIQS